MIDNIIKLPNIDYENKRNLETMLQDLIVEYELHRTSYKVMTKSKSKILRSFLDEIGSLPMDNFLQDGLRAYTQITKQKRQEIVRKNNHQKIVNHIRSKVWPGMSVVDINRLIS